MNNAVDNETVESNEQEIVDRLARVGERGWFQRILDYFYGYDYFISYRWSDGRAYAVGLAEQLQDRGFDCFLDSDDYIKGDNWKKIGERSLRKTSRLVLVGSPHAVCPVPPRDPNNDPVLRELQIFTQNGKRILPINFDGSLTLPAHADAPLMRYLDKDGLWILEEFPQLTMGPSQKTVNDLCNSFDLERQSGKRSRILKILIAVFAALSMAATAAAIVAFVSYRLAESRRLLAESRGRVTNAQRLAAESAGTLSVFPQRSLLLAVSAVQATELDDPFVQEAEQSLRDALAAVGGEPCGRWTSVAPDGKRVAIVRNDGRVQLEFFDSPGDSRTLRHDTPIVRVEQSNRWLAACTENAACALWDLDHPAIPPLVIEDVARVLAISEAGMVIESAKRGAKNYHILQQALADDGRTVRSELLTEFDSFLSVSESSNILAVQRPSESIEIWNLNELSQQRSLDLHGSQLLAISPDGRWGLAGQYGYELLDRGAEPIKRVHLGIPDDWIAFAQFSPDSRFLAAVVADPAALSAALSLAQHPHFRLVFLWDLNDVGGSGTLSERAVISSHPSKVESLFLSEKRLVSASAESMQVRSLLSESLKDPELTVPITSSVLSIRILHERWLVAQLHDHSLKVWDLDSPGKPPHHFIGHDGLVNSVNMSADGAWLFSNRVAESSRRWMLPSIPGDSYNLHKSRWPIHGIAMPDAGVAFVGYENSGPAASGIEKFTISRDGLFAEKEAWTAQMLKSLDVSVNGRWMVWVTQYDASICDLMSTDRSAFGIWQPAVGKPDSCTTTFSSDGRWLMVNSETGKSSLWALPREQGLPTRVSPQAGNPIADDPSYRRIAIEPNGQWMVTSDQSKRVICWNLSGDLPHPTDTMLGNIKLPNQLESVSRDHRWVVLKSPGDLAWLCDLSNPDAAAVRLFNIELPVQSIEVSPDQKWVVTASKSGQSLRLSRIQNVISEPVELDAQTRIIDLNRECEVLFSPDSRHLVVWGVDDVLRLWRLTAPRTAVPLELRGHEQIVRHVTFARDNGCLISGSDDGTIRLWDLNEQEIVSVVLRGHTGPVTALAMAPGLDRLVTGGKDGTIRVWDLWQPNAIKTQRLQELIERATLSAGRELSTAEVKQYLRK